MGSVSLSNGALSLQIVAVDEELEATVVHVARLGEGERLTHEARKPLPEGVDPTLDVASLAFFLAGSLVLLFGDHLLVGFPEIAVAGRSFVALGNRFP